MSSQSDRVAFDNSVQPYDETILFKQKNWTYITDSSSSGGVFNNQLQFDLNTLSSQSQWVDLSEAYVQFPVRVKIKNTGSTSGSLTQSINATVLKNGFHHFVDSVQVVLDGSTVQASQIYENISTTFKIMSEWSQDELRKYGPSLGIALDDYTALDTTAIATIAPSVYGVNLTTTANTGIAARQSIQNIGVASGGCKAILAEQAKNVGKPQVAVVSGAPVAAGSHSYTQFVLATIRLKDISPVLAAMPMSRNLKGFLYINYNSSSTTFSADTSAALTALTTSANAGRCCPVMIRSDLISTSTFGTTASTWEVAVELSGVATEQTTAQPAISYGRLVAPYFVANPQVDAALSMKKTFRYLERNVSTFDIAAGANTTVTLSPGIANPKRVLLYPYFTGAGTTGGTMLTNPLLSPFDATPATTSPFAALKDLQILVANQPMFQNPVSMDWDLFGQEVAQQGLDGGLDSQSASGLLSQQMWDRLYRFYTCDVGRRLESEDGSSKSVIVQCTNATLAPMRVIAMIYYEKEITVDTSMGRVYQGKA